MSTVGYGDDIPSLQSHHENHDKRLFLFTIIQGILAFSYMQGDLIAFLRFQAHTLDYESRLDDKNYQIKHYIVKHNELKGPTPLLSTNLNQYLNAIKVNFKYNI